MPVKRTVISLALFASLAGGAAAADPATTTSGAAGPPPQTTAAAPPKKHGFDANTVICKRETPTGTRIGGQEICMTVAQWDAVQREDEDAFRRTYQRTAGGNGGAGMAGGMR
jgi:hypothetical protein